MSGIARKQVEVEVVNRLGERADVDPLGRNAVRIALSTVPRAMPKVAASSGPKSAIS